MPAASSHAAASSAHVQMAPVRKICAPVVRTVTPKNSSVPGTSEPATTPPVNKITAMMTATATAITVTCLTDKPSDWY
jgi:hypothetical protein